MDAGEKVGRYRLEGDEGYVWEGKYNKTWEQQQQQQQSAQSQDQLLPSSQRRRTSADLDALPGVRRGLRRSVAVCVDLSRSMTSTNLSVAQSYASIAVSAASAFISRLSEQNPLTRVCVLVARNSEAAVLSPLSQGVLGHSRALSSLLTTLACSGEFSLTNALDESLRALCAGQQQQQQSCKEVVIVTGSITTCDARNVYATSIAAAAAGRVRCSVVCLTAELEVFRRLARMTGGTCRVALTAGHVAELLAEHVTPPALSPAAAAAVPVQEAVQVGFPSRQHVRPGSLPMFCACHFEPLSEGAKWYQCPRCSALCCELPCSCAVCGLTLLSAERLARGYHHIFPPPPFSEETSTSTSDTCFSCSSSLPDVRYRCTKCSALFCPTCDSFVRTTLHNCPSCCSFTNPPCAAPAPDEKGAPS